jgi:hypothetical protein
VVTIWSEEEVKPKAAWLRIRPAEFPVSAYFRLNESEASVRKEKPESGVRVSTMAKTNHVTPAQIERMYDAGENRVTQERNDFLLPQVTDFVRDKKWLNLRPEYQRRLVWDIDKKSRFIESLLMNIPVPPVFLYETDLNRYEVMDGQQRLNTILEFYENNLELKGLETWSVLNGRTYSKCPPRIQRGLDRRRISANVLLAENIRDPKHADFIRRTVFERLNTGGQQLNYQELRNSLYSGPLNELLIELAGNRLFDEIWGIPPYEDHYRKEEGYISTELANNKLFRRMKDCELVLRFFAFRDAGKIRGSVRSILDNYMKENRDAEHQMITELRVTFVNCLRIAHAIFGDHTFRIRERNGNWQPSYPLFDAVMVAMDKLVQYEKKLVANRKRILPSLEEKIGKPKVYEIIVGRPNTARAVRARISIIHNLLRRFI